MRGTGGCRCAGAVGRAATASGGAFAGKSGYAASGEIRVRGNDDRSSWRPRRSRRRRFPRWRWFSRRRRSLSRRRFQRRRHGVPRRWLSRRSHLSRRRPSLFRPPLRRLSLRPPPASLPPAPFPPALPSPVLRAVLLLPLSASLPDRLDLLGPAKNLPLSALASPPDLLVSWAASSRMKQAPARAPVVHLPRWLG